jgi:type IV secretion system protein VirB11
MIQIHRPNTRVVTIETDQEFGSIGPENLAPMFFDEQKITADEAVRTALRLAPNEIWYQEVRGGEAYALLRAMESGHAGGGTSWHAEEGRELEALSMMARQHPAGREMSEDRLMQMMRSLIDILVYCEREPSGKFRISSVRFMAVEREQR